MWLLTMLCLAPGAASTVQTGQTPPRFRSSVQMVTVAATIRDQKGRFVRDLTRDDVQVLDRGAARAIQEFRVDSESPVSVALLFDESGSMGVSSRASEARQAAEHLIAAMDPRRDEVAVFAFDSKLRAVAPFTTDLDAARRQLTGAPPFGTTALFDAVSAAAQQVAARGGRRRAVVVLTDGVDTASRLRPEQVSAAASAVDVPVYVVTLLSPLEHEDSDLAVEGRFVEQRGDLASMAHWTGGNVFFTSAPAHASVAARQIVAELRHQYLIAFEASVEPGWHPIEIRVRQRGAVVRARSGYTVSRAASSRG
jgi:VWFA-related protein